MTKTDMTINALIKVALAEDAVERKTAREELRKLVDGNMTVQQDEESITREILLELGAPEHLVGHPYVVQAILLVMQDRTYINKITRSLYPQLADMFDTTASRAERAIRHVIEVIFTRCDYKTINRYFGNSYDPDKGKPTNSEFIARVANVVKLRMKQ